MSGQDEADMVARRFREVVVSAARSAGFDLDRRGEKKRLAEAAGMSPASTSRMLSGLTVPDPTFFPGLAQAIGLSLPELLIQSTLATPEALGFIQRDDVLLAPDEAAVRVGIKRPQNRRLFVSFVQSILKEESGEGGSQIPLDKD